MKSRNGRSRTDDSKRATCRSVLRCVAAAARQQAERQQRLPTQPGWPCRRRGATTSCRAAGDHRRSGRTRPRGSEQRGHPSRPDRASPAERGRPPSPESAACPIDMKSPKDASKASPAITWCPTKRNPSGMAVTPTQPTRITGRRPMWSERCPPTYPATAAAHALTRNPTDSWDLRRSEVLDRVDAEERKAAPGRQSARQTRQRVEVEAHGRPPFRRRDGVDGARTEASGALPG